MSYDEIDMIDDKMDELLNKVMGCLDGSPSAMGCATLANAMSHLLADLVLNTGFIEKDIDGLVIHIKEHMKYLITMHNKVKPNFEVNQ